MFPQGAVMEPEKRAAEKAIQHINHALVAELHPPQYLMHTYWARKPHNVVAEYIRRYSKEGDIVLDPFCGSGVTVIEAVKLGRRAIGIDINPMAIFIARMTAKPIDLEEYTKAFDMLRGKVEDSIRELYKTRCIKCGGTGEIIYTVWENESPKEIYYECSCSRKRLKKRPDREDLRRIKEVERSEIPYWYPKNELRYPDGRPFKEGTHIPGKESIPGLFTKRNLLALSMLFHEISNIRNENVKELMIFTFTCGLHLASRFNPHVEEKWGPEWAVPRYWLPVRFREYNVWYIFEGRFRKVLKGKNTLG